MLDCDLVYMERSEKTSELLHGLGLLIHAPEVRILLSYVYDRPEDRNDPNDKRGKVHAQVVDINGDVVSEDLDGFPIEVKKYEYCYILQYEIFDKIKTLHPLGFPYLVKMFAYSDYYRLFIESIRLTFLHSNQFLLDKLTAKNVVVGIKDEYYMAPNIVVAAGGDLGTMFQLTKPHVETVAYVYNSDGRIVEI